MQTHPIPLADHFAALKQSTAELGAAHALVLALLVRLLDGLVALARRWQAPPRRRRHPLAGKGPIPRDWMVRCQPGRGFRPSFPAPVLRTPAHLLRTPPEPAGSPAARALSPQT
jgi:hypothetical protein